ncbi:MAG: phage head morphogenesis protein, partial [Alloprevotella sp.]
TFPDYNPYTIRRCRDCDIPKTNFSRNTTTPDNQVCEACQTVTKYSKADAKQTRENAKHLQGTTISNPKFPYQISITRNTIKEWTNQPFKYFRDKNIMLLNIGEVMANATYLGVSENHKGVERVVQSHIFKTTVRDIKAYIIVREYDWGDFVLHSISDAQDFIKYVKKK